MTNNHEKCSNNVFKIMHVSRVKSNILCSQRGKIAILICNFNVLTTIAYFSRRTGWWEHGRTICYFSFQFQTIKHPTNCIYENCNQFYSTNSKKSKVVKIAATCLQYNLITHSVPFSPTHPKDSTPVRMLWIFFYNLTCTKIIWMKVIWFIFESLSGL